MNLTKVEPPLQVKPLYQKDGGDHDIFLVDNLCSQMSYQLCTQKSSGNSRHRKAQTVFYQPSSSSPQIFSKPNQLTAAPIQGEFNSADSCAPRRQEMVVDPRWQQDLVGMIGQQDLKLDQSMINDCEEQKRTQSIFDYPKQSKRVFPGSKRLSCDIQI